MPDEIQYDALDPVPTLPSGDADLARVANVPVELAVEIGRTRMTIRETLALGPGSIVTLERLAGEPVDLLVNGKPIARGEVVVIDEEFGLRVTEIVSDQHRLDAATSAPEVAVMPPAAAPPVEHPVPDAVVAPEHAVVTEPAPTPEPDFPVEALDAEPQPEA
jgi:flagellar motor switch protein FliN